MDFIEKNYLVIDSITNETLYIVNRKEIPNSTPYSLNESIVIEVTSDFAEIYSQNIIDGKHYKLKDANGSTIETMLTEFIPEIVLSPSIFDRVKALEEVQLGSLGI